MYLTTTRSAGWWTGLCRGNFDAQLAARQLEEAGFESRAEVGNAVPNLTATLSDSRLHEADGDDNEPPYPVLGRELGDRSLGQAA